MGMLINHNLFAKDVAHMYNRSVDSFKQSMSKLSSGLRTSVTDFHDASGMEIAQQITSKINGYSKAISGGQDGISLIQTAEGGLTEVDAMLDRMRELAVKASNDTLTGQDRKYIQAEIDQLRNEIDRIGNTTHFNNKKLLNGSAAALWSSIPKETQAVIKGSLKGVDQFGQDFNQERNFNIKLKAMPPGNAQVQKTNIFNSNGEAVNDGGAQLGDLDNFTSSDGKNYLTEPQTITITQADGKQSEVTFYASDTLDEAAAKINDAIANDLGQASYVDNKNNFASFVSSPDNINSQSVAGTIVIRSAIAGAKGELTFSGSEAFINALGLNTIQASSENIFEAEVSDAHTGEILNTVKVTGNELKGVLHDNIDIEFDAMAGISSNWDENSKSYITQADDYLTSVHVADASLSFQMGIGSKQDMLLSIGDVRSKSLGLDKINTADYKAAARSISVIDEAIDRVSTERAKLGAYINRIEYNLDNMRTAEENMTSAESNIKDTDMAKEMMHFVQEQIHVNASSAMLAQANQTQEMILGLLGEK